MQSANVKLSDQDIDYIARVVETEVPHGLARSDPEEYAKMVQAVTDTIVNRMGSSSYPNSSTGVANQSRQFSKINGPKGYRDANGRYISLNPYGTVQNAPRASSRVQGIVEEHLKDRARGKPSIIGNDVNYANPTFSSPNNLSWIREMANEPGAQKFGRGNAFHIHGTAPWSRDARTNVTLELDSFSPSTGRNSMAWSPEAAPSKRVGAQSVAAPTPTPRYAAFANPLTPVTSEPLAALANEAQKAINTRFPSQQQIAASRPAQNPFQTAMGPTTRPNNAPDPWGMPRDIQRASAQARRDLGMPTRTPTKANFDLGGGSSGASSYTSPSVSEQLGARRSYGMTTTGAEPSSSKMAQAYQEYGQSRSAAPQYIEKEVTRTVPLPSKPTSIAYDSPQGQKMVDAYSQYGATRSAANAPPIPTAKPMQQFQTVTDTVKVPNPAYRGPAPAPVAQPQMTPVEKQGILSRLGGAISPAGMVGGIVGNAVGGPFGGIAGNLVGRGISRAVQNNPTIGNRGTTNSYSTASGSGGPYEGQSWRNTSSGGTRVFNPSTRQYEDIGGRNAGNRSESQSTPGGCYITTAAVDVMGEKDHGETLTTLRWFRDNVMLKRQEWAADVAEYYRIAPDIVKRLDGDRATYERIYSGTLRPAADAVLAGDYEHAYRLYKNMVNSLRGIHSVGTIS